MSGNASNKGSQSNTTSRAQSQSQNQSASQSSAKIAEQEDFLKQALSLFGGELGQNNVFGGERVAGLNPLQTTSAKAAKNVGNAFRGNQSTQGFSGGPLAGETTSAVSDLLGGRLGAQEITPEQFGDFFQASTADPSRKTFREDTTPAISEAFAGPGFFSSARSREIVDRKTDLEDSLQRSLSQGQFATLQRNQDIAEAKAGRTQGAVGQAIQVGQAEAQDIRNNISIAASQVQGLKELMGIGSVTQTQEQKEIFATMERFAQENQITDPENIAIMMSLLNLNFGTSASVSSGASESFGTTDSVSKSKTRSGGFG